MKTHQRKKKQHTVPAMYLKAFASDGAEQLVQYSRDDMSVEWVSIKRASVKKHAYTIDQHPKLDAMAVENSLMRVESLATEPLRCLRDGESLSPRQKFSMAEFLFLQMQRTTHWLKHQEDQANEFSKPENTIAFVKSERELLVKKFGAQAVDSYIRGVEGSGGSEKRLFDSQLWQCHAAYPYDCFHDMGGRNCARRSQLYHIR